MRNKLQLKKYTSDNPENMNKSRLYNLILSLLLVIIFSFSAFADSTGPGDPGGGPELGDPPLGGGAPIESGLAVFLLLSLGYGGKKSMI